MAIIKRITKKGKGIFFCLPDMTTIDIDTFQSIILTRLAPSKVGSRAGYMGPISRIFGDGHHLVPPIKRGVARSQKEQARVSLGCVVLFWMCVFEIDCQIYLEEKI